MARPRKEESMESPESLIKEVISMLEKKENGQPESWHLTQLKMLSEYMESLKNGQPK